jgi:O-antigen ligase
VSLIGAGGLREKAGGVLLALYVLAGRWGVERLFSDVPPGEMGLSVFELRFWLVLALLAFAFAQRGQGVSVPARSGVRRFALTLNLFLIWVLLSALWAPDPDLALYKVVEVLIVLLAGVAVHKFVTGSRAPEWRRHFWGFLFAVTGLLALIALSKAVAEGPARLAVLGGGPNVFGRLMGLSCLASLYFWRRRGGPLFIGGAVLALLLVILTGSRGCFISLVLAAAGFFLVERVRLERLALLGVVAGVLGTAVFTQTPVGRAAIATYEHRVNRLLLQERYTSGRGDLYQLAWDMGLERPVLGGGLNAFPGRGYGVYCHNFFLEVFSETGLVGLTLFLLLFALFLARCAAAGASLDGTTVAAFLFTLGAAQFSGDFYDSRSLFVFMAMAYLPKDARG